MNSFKNDPSVRTSLHVLIAEKADEERRRGITNTCEWVMQSEWLACGMFGSHAHGTFIDPSHKHGTDDTDVFVVTIQPVGFYAGMGYTRRHCFSTAGDAIDLLVYDARKVMTMLLGQNPNTHAWLWTDKINITSPGWDLLVSERQNMLSKWMFRSLTKYADGQFTNALEAGTKKRYMGEKRQKIMEEFGFDTRSAAHAVRLYLQAYLLALHGEIRVDLGIYNDTIKSIKRGEMTFEKVGKMIEDIRPEVNQAIEQSQLPDDVPVEFFDRLWLRVLSDYTLR